MGPTLTTVTQKKRLQSPQDPDLVRLQWIISREAKNIAWAAASASGFSEFPGLWLDELIKKYSPRVSLSPPAAEQTAA